MKTHERRIAVLYHNVRSAHNVGALFRTADGAGAERIYLTGYTPVPEDRFGRAQTDIAKTALGAEKTLSWNFHKHPIPILRKLHREGWHIIGVEQDKRSRPYQLFSITKPTVFVFGNEVRGLSKNLRDYCDFLLEIPMLGKKESLNVSVATGIMLYHAIR